MDECQPLVYGRDFIVGQTAVRLGEFTAAAPHAAGQVAGPYTRPLLTST